MQPVPGPGKQNAPKTDPLTDDLKWDFLRDLVDHEFAKMELESTREQPGSAHFVPVKTMHPVPSAEALSAANTAFNSPESQPVPVSPVLSSLMSPFCSPARSPGDAQMAPPLMPREAHIGTHCPSLEVCSTPRNVPEDFRVRVERRRADVPSGTPRTVPRFLPVVRGTTEQDSTEAISFFNQAPVRYSAAVEEQLIHGGDWMINC
jgi:hypothetical protein